MKLHLFGASGTGVTTLGQALSVALSCPYFDTDDYFWRPTAPAFTQRRPPAARDAQLAADLAAHERWVVGGSIVGWGEAWLAAFDLAVFLWVPPALRLQRLAAREQARYGAALAPDPTQATRTAEFRAWAAGYDASSTGGTRTLANHERWLQAFTCPVLELRGDLSVAARVAAVLARLPTL